MLFFITGFMLNCGVLRMDKLQTKLAVRGPGLVEWYFEIHFHVYFLSMWHEWPAFIVSAEKCVPWDFFSGSVLFPTLQGEVFFTIFYHEPSVPHRS